MFLTLPAVGCDLAASMKILFFSFRGQEAHGGGILDDRSTECVFERSDAREEVSGVGARTKIRTIRVREPL